MDHEGRGLKSQMKQADKLGARYVAILGEDELAEGRVDGPRHGAARARSDGRATTRSPQYLKEKIRWLSRSAT